MGVDNTAVVKIVDDLTLLAVKYKIDKWGAHWYTQHYSKHFQKYRESKINLLEIGVGGYNDPTVGGDSLRMWAEYFPLANIYGLDICPKALSPIDRVSIFQGNQSDPNCLINIFNTAGGLDIVVDDGSHQNDDIIKSFKFLFTLLNHGGMYVVEDIQTSYWPSEGQPRPDPDSTETGIGYFRSLIHCLNYEERLDDNYRPTFMDRHIVGMHFYHNLVFIEKGDNREGSNILLNNQLRKP